MNFDFTPRVKRAMLGLVYLACAALSLATAPAHAQLKIDVTGVGQSQIAFSAAPFTGNAGLPVDIKSVIEADLVRSGYFKSINTSSNVVLDENTVIDPTAWKSIGVDALVVGSVKKLADGRLDVRFNLHDTVQQKSVGRFSYVINPSALRLTSHKIADYIYKTFLGEPGIFATRIAYVEKSPGQSKLIVADADGANQQVALASREPIISPTWSPDGKQLAYVSFETKKPVVFVYTLATGQRRAVANFRGSNSAPAWAPNSQKLAVVLTKDSGSQIYTMNLDGSDLKRLTNTGGINTEPVYSADGKSIYFTSDRSGGPQVYRMDSDGSNATRVTFEGNYNISPKVSPDGKSLTYVNRSNGQFKVMIMDLSSGTTQSLTNTSQDESPSFSPNNRYILYATKSGGKGVLAVVSSDGRVRNELTSSNASITEPTWGPFVDQ